MPIFAKITEIKIQDKNRHNVHGEQKPEYLATVKIKLDGALVTLEDFPVAAISAGIAAENAADLMRQALEMIEYYDLSDMDYMTLPSLAERAEVPVAPPVPVPQLHTDDAQVIMVKSSHGSLKCNSSGAVINQYPNCDTPKDYEHFMSITYFDFPEWQMYWRQPLPESIDILDLGYWYEKDKRYEPADPDWRNEIAIKLHKREKGKLTNV